jgi:hypothetical protein
MLNGHDVVVGADEDRATEIPLTVDVLSDHDRRRSVKDDGTCASTAVRREANWPIC